MSEAVCRALQTSWAWRRGLSLTSNQLKLLAVAAMAFDHCMVTFVPHGLALYPLLRLPGRLTAPIMCFLLAEGYYHTSNLKRYMGRLFGMALVSHLPFTLCFGNDPWAFWRATDVMWSLLLGLIALTAYLHKSWRPWKRAAAVLLCCLLSYPADWNYIAVLMVLGFGVLHGERDLQTAAHLGVGGLYLAQGVLYGAALATRIGIFLSIPLLRHYNGQRGRKSKAIQWRFYWFYPLHLAALCLFKQLS